MIILSDSLYNDGHFLSEHRVYSIVVPSLPPSLKAVSVVVAFPEKLPLGAFLSTLIDVLDFP